MSEDSTLRAVQKDSETSVQNEAKATTTTSLFSKKQTCLKHHSALASWQQMEVSEQSLHCQPHMNVRQWEFGREKHLAKNVERTTLHKQNKKTTSVRLKQKIHLPNKWQRLWWREEKTLLSPRHTLAKTNELKQSGLKTGRSPRDKQGKAEGINPPVRALIHWRSASLALCEVLRRCKMLGKRKEGEREGRVLGGVSSRAEEGGWIRSFRAFSFIHTWGRVTNGGRENNSLQKDIYQEQVIKTRKAIFKNLK